MEKTRLTRVKRHCLDHAREWTMLRQEVHEIETGIMLDLGKALDEYKKRYPENVYIVQPRL